ncbi:MAG: hypothetical protein V3S08_06220 [Phycisphaerales bacterium]
MTTTALVAFVLAAAPVVDNQILRVDLTPDTHAATISSRLRFHGKGVLRIQLTRHADIGQILLDGDPVEFSHDGDLLTVTIDKSPSELVIDYHARLVEDVAAGERAGEIHNQSVQAHIGPDGVFLSDGAAWHPRPLDDDDLPALHRISVDIEPLMGWALVASGDPAAHLQSITDPVWNWRTPRPVDGLAIAGGRHELHGRVHMTSHGPVEVVMQVPAEHGELASLFLDAAGEYLDLYTPLLGAFPYKRFSIIENFFSSGFAYPGFTVLGPRVVAMAPRSLAPGYLDHELLHNWWGNGVYVDPDDGNWCEAMTSFCANYFRRIADDGAEAGRMYRRGILMKLSTDPDALDDGPLGAFGTDGGPGRFVGYDKGTFFFIMLSGLSSYDSEHSAGEAPWRSLRRFAESHMGRRADWADIQQAFETTMGPDKPAGWLDDMFRRWVREHTVPGADDEPDPQYMQYRVLPPEQIIPTVAGTTGKGGMAVEADASRPQINEFLERTKAPASAQNLMLIGAYSIAERADLIRRTTDPIVIAGDGFTVGGVSYDGPGQAVLHTMQYPGRPGRFITIFHSNGETGWSRLRLILFYTRDSTIVWDHGQVIARRVFEPGDR